jgi:hypothetical protein
VIVTPVFSGIEEFDSWFEIPSPGYTIFWTMPETHRDPDFLITRWIESHPEDTGGFLAHCTRYDVDGFLRRISSLDPGCLNKLLGMGADMHFVDSYSVRLELFGRPVGEHDGLDVRYVTENSKARGAGTISDVLREIREEFSLDGYIGLENNITDLAIEMGEFQHLRLFSEMVDRAKCADGTMIGIADWYSHDEVYKASIIHLADAAMLWGITSGNNKTKYLLPIKREEISPATGFHARHYEISKANMRLHTHNPRNSSIPQAHEDLYR